MSRGRPVERLDVLLVARGLVETRTRAQAVILAGDVTVDGTRVDKPGTRVPVDAAVQLRARPPFVGRGGIKLAAALDRFGVDPTGLVCLDVGASTGGFTDALLQRGARRVYAVDVGRGQLAWSLRGDERVVSMERTDIRSLVELPERADLATIDVAFISLRLVLEPVTRHLSLAGRAIALVKPQFEAGREQVGRGGRVTDPTVHRAVLERVLRHAVDAGWVVGGAMPSPVRGQAGNREFLVLLGTRGAGLEPLDVGAAADAAMVE